MKPLFALAVLLLLVTGCGARPEDAIQHAIRASPEVRNVPGDRLIIDVWRIRIARSDPHFATALVRARDHGGRQVVDTAFVYLRRTDRWRVVGLGTAMVYPSCAQTPRPVVIELFGGWCFGARGALSRLQ